MAAKNRVVILADSLAMARGKDEGNIPYEATWPYLLATENTSIEVINKGMRARTILHTKNELQEIELLTPDIVIIQVGVVDGAPRIFSHSEKSMLKKLPNSLRKRIISYRSKRRNKITSKNPLAKVDVNPNEFEKIFKEVIDKLKADLNVKRVIIIPIVADFVFMDKKSSGFSSNIKLYNTIIHRVAKETKAELIEVDAFSQSNTEKMFCDDGYHLSIEGNKEIKNSISYLLAV